MSDLKEWDGRTPPAYGPMLAPVDKATARTIRAMTVLFAAALVAVMLLVAAWGVYTAPVDDMKVRPEVGKRNFWVHEAARKEGEAMGYLDMSRRAVEEGALCARQPDQCDVDTTR
jgi:hypothetical protein